MYVQLIYFDMNVIINVTNEDFKNILEITKKRFSEIKNPDYGTCIEMFLIWQVAEIKNRSKRIDTAAEKIKQIK